MKKIMPWMAAMMALAQMYQEGNGVAKDPTMAFDWYTAAAENGVIDAMRELFFIYQDGIGVGKDQEMAITWLHHASDRGDSWAQEMLRDIGRDFDR